MTALITINGEVYELTRVRSTKVASMFTIVPFVGDATTIILNKESTELVLLGLMGLHPTIGADRKETPTSAN